MNVAILPTPEAACLRAAEIVAALLAAKPEAVLALPAGNTPRPVYAELVRRHHEAGLSFAAATAFSLDEYAGIAGDHRASFRRTLNDELFRHVDLPRERAHTPNATAADLGRVRAVRARDRGRGWSGPVPARHRRQRARRVQRARLALRCAHARRRSGRRHAGGGAAAFGDEPVPTRALTIGVATILAARRCVLLAYGAAKAGVIARALRARRRQRCRRRRCSFTPTRRSSSTPRPRPVCRDAGADQLAAITPQAWRSVVTVELWTTMAWPMTLLALGGPIVHAVVVGVFGRV